MKPRVQKVNVTAKNIRRWFKNNEWVHVALAVLVFLVTFSAFIYYWNGARSTINKNQQAAFRGSIKSFENAAVSRLLLYQNLTTAGSGLINNDVNLSQTDWQSYFSSFQISQSFNDIEGIGYSQYVTNDNLSNFLAERAASGQPNFTIRPAGNRSTYVVVVYNAMYSGNNGKSIGYDGYSDPTRRAAMLAATTSGQPAMSGVVHLVSNSNPSQPAFIIYKPTYTAGLPIATAAERQSAIAGYVYVAVNINSLLSNLLDANPNPDFAISFYDSQSQANKPAYQSPNYQTINAMHGTIKELLSFTLYNHKWQLDTVGSVNLVPPAERQLPLLILSRGIVISFILALAVWYVINWREQRFSHIKRMEVQNAKDDLLSLASHQLRTPATVVKQYIGMVLQGYAGKVSSTQRKMLKNAYNSNERQLSIISQLLYVARLDSGRITIRPEKIDLGKLIKSVIKNQSSLAKERHQTIDFIQPKRPIHIKGDTHYLTMALDNLLNNSIKYTKSRGKISFSLKHTQGGVIMKLKDNGVGISENEIAIIFDKFTRSDNPLANDVNGSGLGLYLTKQIIDLHNGLIEVSSVERKGTTFTIMLPIDSDFLDNQS